MTRGVGLFQGRGGEGFAGVMVADFYYGGEGGGRRVLWFHLREFSQGVFEVTARWKKGGKEASLMHVAGTVGGKKEKEGTRQKPTLNRWKCT